MTCNPACSGFGSDTPGKRHGTSLTLALSQCGPSLTLQAPKTTLSCTLLAMRGEGGQALFFSATKGLQMTRSSGYSRARHAMGAFLLSRTLARNLGEKSVWGATVGARHAFPVIIKSAGSSTLLSCLGRFVRAVGCEHKVRRPFVYSHFQLLHAQINPSYVVHRCDTAATRHLSAPLSWILRQ